MFNVQYLRTMILQSLLTCAKQSLTSTLPDLDSSLGIQVPLGVWYFAQILYECLLLCLCLKTWMSKTCQRPEDSAPVWFLELNKVWLHNLLFRDFELCLLCGGSLNAILCHVRSSNLARSYSVLQTLLPEECFIVRGAFYCNFIRSDFTMLPGCGFCLQKSTFLSKPVENFTRMLFIKFYICASAPFFNFAIAFSPRALNGARFHIPPNSS